MASRRAIAISGMEGILGALGISEKADDNALSSAVSLIPNAPRMPSIPEIALARRDAKEAASKVAAFAYDRETRQPVWQSGVKHSVATARDTWVLGIGPFQGGSIREQTKLAGSRLKFGPRSATGSPAEFYQRPPVDYTAEVRFDKGEPIFDHGGFGPDMLDDPLEDIKFPDADEKIADEPPVPDDDNVIAESADEKSIQR